jgi:cytochrome c oxidase subunit 5a
MPSASLLRVAAQALRAGAAVAGPAAVARSSPMAMSVTRLATPMAATTTMRAAATAGFHSSAVRASEHQEETFEEFSERFEKEFDAVQDVFELQRNLNNCFAYDLVPSPSVITAALKAARRVNDFPTAVRIFEAIKNKVENRSQYDEYLEELKHLREEFGIPLKEDMYPDDGKNWKNMI